MKAWFLFAILNLVTVFSKAQPEKELILITVGNNRLELAKALKFLNVCSPKLICVNVDLTECDNTKYMPSNHFVHVDTLVVIRPSESEKALTRELAAMGSLLLLPSQIRRLWSDVFVNDTGCLFLYPVGATIGFVNLIDKQGDVNLVEKFQISNTFGKKVSYHFAVDIALRLNLSAANSFINSHPNIVSINFERTRKFKNYDIKHFYENKESIKTLKNKVVILNVDRPEEYRQISEKEKMTTSEIFANIACQLIESTKSE